MSGTSVDGIDCAVLDTTNERTRLVHTLDYPIPDAVRSKVTQISHSGEDEIERLGTLDRQLGQLFAQAALQLLNEAGIDGKDILAIGSHGQTIRHRPPSGGHATSESFTLQIGDPNTIAEITGITTVADFRRRDLAAGGEGAPLAPAFHADAFGQPHTNRAIVNIGGIANVSLLEGEDLVSGFDTGPGNTLMDHWINRHRSDAFDRNGSWAASGRIEETLLRQLLQHPYLDLRGPRSTGKEAFNRAWLEEILTALPAQDAADVQATLAEYTAITIAGAIKDSDLEISELYVCGGGAHNCHLLERLAIALPGVHLADTGSLGIPPDWVEAATFAWLAWRTLAALPGNAPVVTGARGPRVLGAIYPGNDS
ncbi:anhydro-N-acetylmuramic acid kinase [Pseudohalioglobus lutimaris]|uniref:Anhydro-N-acetylmuramic acid kinase n=2 Tax=Pseudohalioglobus lutimaris TaxID=1737061 RepID=A0A2N5X1C5_9GAMM|nr:anhydro-N-acetylmuramic acid kinase [Pseudohalioglobus lutimaris]